MAVTDYLLHEIILFFSVKIKRTGVELISS